MDGDVPVWPGDCEGESADDPFAPEFDDIDLGPGGRGPEAGMATTPSTDNLRGWLAPAERSWVHPSETGPFGGGSKVGGSGDPGLASRGTPGPAGTGASYTGLYKRRTAVAVGVVLVSVSIAAGGFLLAMPLARTPGVLKASSTATTAVTASTTAGLSASVPLSGQPLATAPSGVGQPALAPGWTVSNIVRHILPSLVSVVASGANGTSGSATGVETGSSCITMTAAGSVANARSVEVVTSDGRRYPAVVSGIDQETGVASLLFKGSCTAAPFGTGNPAPGGIALAVALPPPAGNVPGATKAHEGSAAVGSTHRTSSRSRGHRGGQKGTSSRSRRSQDRSTLPQADIAVGVVDDQSESAALASNDSLIDGITMDIPPSFPSAGAALINSAGEIEGILGELNNTGPVPGRIIGPDYAEGASGPAPGPSGTGNLSGPGAANAGSPSGSEPMGVFVPAGLALGVTDQLYLNHQVVHGWLGISAADTGGSNGVIVTGVTAGQSASAAGIRPGEVILDVDGQPVPTLDALRASLYVIPPTSEVTLDVQNGTSIVSVDATLGPCPPGGAGCP